MTRRWRRGRGLSNCRGRSGARPDAPDLARPQEQGGRLQGLSGDRRDEGAWRRGAGPQKSGSGRATRRRRRAGGAGCGPPRPGRPPRALSGSGSRGSPRRFAPAPLTSSPATRRLLWGLRRGRAAWRPGPYQPRRGGGGGRAAGRGPTAARRLPGRPRAHSHPPRRGLRVGGSGIGEQSAARLPGQRAGSRGHQAARRQAGTEAAGLVLGRRGHEDPPASSYVVAGPVSAWHLRAPTEKIPWNYLGREQRALFLFRRLL